MGQLRCPHCRSLQDRWDQPRLTVDAVVFDPTGKVLLIERRGAPPGWALPGGFVDAGETLDEAAGRELEEETGLKATSLKQFYTYSNPARDPRHPTVTTIYIAEGAGTLKAGDDARDARFFDPNNLPSPMAFDHADIIRDIRAYLNSGQAPCDRLG